MSNSTVSRNDPATNLPTPSPKGPEPTIFFVPFVAALIALGPFAIDTYLPAMPGMAQDLNTSIVMVNYTLSTYLIGFAFGQLVGGPLSDQVGRRPIGIVGLVVFIICSGLITLADSVNSILVLRFFQALGGGFSTVICMAMVRDSYSPMEAAKRFPRIMLVMLIAPLIAPAIGAGLLSYGWQSIFIFLALYAAALGILLASTNETANTRTGKLSFQRIIPQYLQVLRTRLKGKLIPLRYILAQGFMASVLMTFITNASYIYLEYYDVGTDRFVFFFAANVVGMMCGNFVASHLIHRVAPFPLYVWARAVQFCGMVALMAIVTFTEPSTAVFTPLLALTIGCAGVIGPSVQGLYLAPFKALSGSASSLMNTSTFLVGSIMGVVSGLFYDGTLRPIIYTMMVALVVGNLIAFTIVRTDPATTED